MLNLKSYIPLLVTVLVLVIVSLVVFPQFANYKDVIETIDTLSFTEVLILLLITIVNILFYAVPFMVATVGIKYWPAFMVRQTSFLISNGIPGGGTIGVGVQYVMTTGYKISGHIASSGIVLTSIWNMLATMSLPGLSILLLLLTGNMDNQNAIVAVLGILLAIISITSYITIIKYEKLINKISINLESFYNLLVSKFKVLPKLQIISNINKFRVVTYKSTVENWRSLLLVNIAQQFTQFIILFATIEMLQPDTVSVLTALAAFAFARIATFIPLTPGGLGTVDAILVTLLVEGGVTSEVALASTLVWRAATYFPQIFIGGITFLVWRLKSKN